MFVIRQAMSDDATTLLKLAKMVHFINLPADPDIIATKIVRSRRSFNGQMETGREREREFMFVLEDTETGNVVGTSSIVSHISWPGHPHVFLQVQRREHYSEDLQSGQVHTTVQLGVDESGPSEIGGLILSPSYRRHRDKLGAQLSLVRFHFMGLHRAWFADRVIAEMMGALTPDSRNLLWTYLGRKFINLDYKEADGFSQDSKEFILSLFPRSEIYVSLLPAVARQLIGKVGPETEPARAMLEALGFKSRGQIDPFDGGPYLEADVGSIPLVQQTRRIHLSVDDGELPSRGMVSRTGQAGYRAVSTAVAVDDTDLTISPAAAAKLGAKAGEEVGFTPLPSRTSAGPHRGRPEAAAR